MLIVLSPAKTLDFDSPVPIRNSTEPRFQVESTELVESIRKKSPAALGKLMRLSPKLAALNHQRFHDWRPDFSTPDARQAIFAFRGDVYLGLDVGRYTARDLNYAQRHLRILSGLHGLLRPLDCIRPYRLEMGTSLTVNRRKDLYAFWGYKITETLNDDLSGQKPAILVNLASNEYFSAVSPEKIDARIINPVFKDTSRGGYRVLSFFAKRARGEMATWLVQNRIKRVKDIIHFNLSGYRYSGQHSSPGNPTFIRDRV